jgi:hypothetical protein
MRTAALPSFRKLWGRIVDNDLEVGMYELKIANSMLLLLI